MSKLDDLLKQYCPDGVEYKRLGDIGNFYGGLSGKSKDDFGKGDNYYVTYLNVFSNLEVDLEKCEKVKISKNERQNALSLGDVIFTGSSETPDECGISSVVTKQPEFPVYLNSFCFFLRLSNSNLMIPEYAKYVFRASETRKKIIKTASGVTRFNVSKKKMEEVTIPIPPLAVQEVIANILDSFTKLTARRAQYEYYRDKLLSFDDETAIVKRIKDMLDKTCGGAANVEYRLLSDVVGIRRGKRVTRQDLSESGEYPVFQNSLIPLGYYNECNVEAESPYIICAGAAGDIGYCSSQFWAADDCFFIEHPELITRRYVYYFLLTKQEYLKSKVRKASVPRLAHEFIDKLEIPIPPFAVQQEIVSILDKFNTLTTDIFTGLPAEISLRQKQYEHYRDRLLNFNGGV